MSFVIKTSLLFVTLMSFLTACSDSTPGNPAETETVSGSITITTPIETDTATDISDLLPYTSSITGNTTAVYKVSNGIDGEIYAFTLTTPTAGSTLGLSLYPDSDFFPSIGFDVANILEGAEIILKAQGSNIYLQIAKESGDAASIGYTFNVQTYDDYAGLIDLTGIYPYAGMVSSNSAQPYQLGGLLANTVYQLSFTNITDDIDVIANNDKLKMIDESYIPCSGYVTTSSFNCNVATDNNGFIYIKVTNSAGFTVSYDINVTP